MQPRPTPTSPRYVHRYNPPPPPNVPLLVVTAFTAAILTVLLGAALLRLTEQRPPISPTPGTSQPQRPYERVREARGSTVVALEGADGAVVGFGVAVSNDGWVLTIAPLPQAQVVRSASGTTAAVGIRVPDAATAAVFLGTTLTLDPVPFGLAEDRYLGEPVALLSPGPVPDSDVVSSATVVATRSLLSGAGVQRSDSSPTGFLLEAAATPNPATPVFSLSGDFLGLTLTPDAQRRVPVLPAWLLRRGVASVLSDGVLARASLGVSGRPAEAVAPGTSGFVVSAVARGSAAEAAGIAVGDAVERVGDTDVTVESPLADLLLDQKPGDRVTLTVRRRDADRSLDVVLGTVAQP